MAFLGSGWCYMAIGLAAFADLTVDRSCDEYRVGYMNDMQLFEYNSMRSRLARVHIRLRGWARHVHVGLSVLAISLGSILIVQGFSAGWFILTLGSWPLLPLLWEERYLRNLPPAAGNRIDDRLEVDALGLLRPQLDKLTLVEVLPQVRSVQFMMARAGLSPQLISEQMDQSEVIAAWQYASSAQPEGVVHASTLFAGFVAADQRLTGVLPHLQLGQSDVDAVAQWYIHLDKLITKHAQPKFTGGIARDWSFGWANYLSRFGTNVSEQVARSGLLSVDIESHREALQYLTQVFSTSGRQNVALVGPTGSGKTTIVKAFAESLLSANSSVPSSLKFHQVISLDASALISAASGRGQLEELLNALLVEAHRAKNIILCFDDAQLFFEEGVGSVDVSNLLLPVLDGGGIRIIFTMDEQRFLQISQRNPNLAQSLNKFMVTPSSHEETLRVLQDQLISLEFSKKITYMYQALNEAYRLSERYLYDLAQPGKALQLLSSASQYAEKGLVTGASVQRAIEQTQGVKVGANVSGDDKERLLNLENYIHERMINQVRAVSVVSDALRRARAGVRNEKRPIGTFLFLGPTGVGKTELAKALASVYFNGEDRLVRLDMNEFVSPDDVRRLIADGAEDPHSLSAQVMRQPFSVVLLDELEKAHDSVLTTLLQVLDEGILRDIKGREVSFRDAIIIATSNAGADHIRHHIERGEDISQFEEALTNELISSGEFRPEFLNRFDEIVVFRPLNPNELKQVIDLIIVGINKTLEPQKISVTVDDQLKDWLVATGNDPRLGARPMRRIVQRVVENTVAKRMLSGEVQPGEAVQLTIADIPTETTG